MRGADPAHVLVATRLLEHESDGTSLTCAVAAGLICEKLHLHLAPLLGTVGVELLLTRSVRVTQARHAGLVGVTFANGATTLPEILAAQSAESATESAVALFAAFFTLLASFIGERLTTQVLRKAWPAIDLTTEPTSKDGT